MQRKSQENAQITLLPGHDGRVIALARSVYDVAWINRADRNVRGAIKDLLVFLRRNW